MEANKSGTPVRLTPEYLDSLGSVCLFDVETDGLYDNCTRVWCAVIYAYKSKTVYRYTPNDINDFISHLSSYDVIIGHNVIDFDLAVLGKLYGYDSRHQIVIDTLIASKLMFHNIKEKDWAAINSQKDQYAFMNTNDFRDKNNRLMDGRHSLESWGYRLQFPKLVFTKFDAYTEEMLDYCTNDVTGPNLHLFDLQLKQNYPMLPVVMEGELQRIISKQMRFGWKFDTKLANATLAELTVKRQIILDDLQKIYKGWTFPLKTPQYWYIDYDGRRYTDPSKMTCVSIAYKAANKDSRCITKTKLAELVQPGPVKTSHRVFSPGSSDDVSCVLIVAYGWKPKTKNRDDLYTDKTLIVKAHGDKYKSFIGKPKPKFDYSIQESFLSGNESYNTKYKHEVEHLINQIMQFEVYQDRIEKLSEGRGGGYVGFERNGRLHGNVDCLGTVTHRATHRDPHLGQVPSPKLEYGEAFRRMFLCDDNHILVGSDADALEMRCFAHHLFQFDNGVYATAVDKGDKAAGTDAHSINQRAVKADSRDRAKTLFYAYLYGAGNWKLGDTYGTLGRLKEFKGAEVRHNLESGITGLQDLLKCMSDDTFNFGYVTLVDGRKINVRKESAALNSLLQGEGSIICKLWLVFVDYLTQISNVTSFNQLYWLHDEFVGQIKPEEAQAFKPISQQAMTLVEYVFDYKCPLKVSYSTGKNWYDVH